MFKGIFFSDLHFSKKRQDLCLIALDKIIEYTEKTELPVFFCGDLSDFPMTATKASGYTELVSRMAKLNQITNVYMVSGTASHEADGFLDVFENIGIHVYTKNTFLTTNGIELVALPEPRKTHYSPRLNETIEDCINREFQEFLKTIPEKKSTHRICIGHGEIFGSSLNGGIVSISPIAFKPDLLKEMNCDYLAFGHVHSPQIIYENEKTLCEYIGSAVPNSFAETHSAGFKVVTID